MSELITQKSFDIEFKPAKLEFQNYEEMKALVKSYADQYKGLVFTRSEKYGATKARTELLALKNAIDTNRKNVKKVYNQPLADFEELAKELTDLIDEPLEGIRGGLKVIDEEEKAEREEVLNKLIIEKIGDTGISIDDVEKDPRWINKGNWTAQMEPKGKFEADIENAVEAAVKERDQKEANIKILTEFCKAQDIDPAGWVKQLEYRSATEVIDSIQQEKKKQEELEKGRLEKELQRKEQEELQQKKQEEMQRQKQLQDEAEQRTQQAEFSAVPESESTVEPVTISKEERPVEPVLTDVIEVKGTLEQLIQLNEYASSIGVRVKKHEKPSFDFDATLDDLPFF